MAKFKVTWQANPRLYLQKVFEVEAVDEQSATALVQEVVMDSVISSSVKDITTKKAANLHYQMYNGNMVIGEDYDDQLGHVENVETL